MNNDGIKIGYVALRYMLDGAAHSPILKKSFFLFYGDYLFVSPAFANSGPLARGKPRHRKVWTAFWEKANWPSKSRKLT